MKAWDRDISEMGQELDWDAICNNVIGPSKNPNHLKFCHRAYLTPRIRHRMGLVPDPYCSFFSQGTVGSFIHVVWECFNFWGKVISTLTELTGVQLPMDPAVHLLNDDSHLSLTKKKHAKSGWQA